MTMPCTGCTVLLLAMAIAPAITGTRHGYHSRDRQQYGGEDDDADMVEGLDDEAREITDHGVHSSVQQAKNKVGTNALVA